MLRRAIELNLRQASLVESAAAPCSQTCALLYPLDDSARAACVEECQSQHRELLRLVNASELTKWAVAALFVGALVFTVVRLRTAAN